MWECIFLSFCMMLLVSLPEMESEGEGLRLSSARLTLGSNTSVCGTVVSLVNGQMWTSQWLVKPVKYLVTGYVYFSCTSCKGHCTTYRWRFTPNTLKTLLQSECCVSHPLNLLLLFQQQLPFLHCCLVGFLKTPDLSLGTWLQRESK